MPLWDKTSSLPKYLKRTDKRKTIATDRGFVIRTNYTDSANNARVKEEILVSLEGVANSTNFGSPSISDTWFASPTAANNTVVTFFVSFDEPIAYANSTQGTLQIAIANTALGANNLVAVSNTTFTGANNTIKFTFTPTVPGTYALAGQTIANATATVITSLKSLNSGNEAISLVMSNTAAALAGTVVVS